MKGTTDEEEVAMAKREGEQLQSLPIESFTEADVRRALCVQLLGGFSLSWPLLLPSLAQRLPSAACEVLRVVGPLGPSLPPLLPLLPSPLTDPSTSSPSTCSPSTTSPSSTLPPSAALSAMANSGTGPNWRALEVFLRHPLAHPADTQRALLVAKSWLRWPTTAAATAAVPDSLSHVTEWVDEALRLRLSSLVRCALLLLTALPRHRLSPATAALPARVCDWLSAAAVIDPWLAVAALQLHSHYQSSSPTPSPKSPQSGRAASVRRPSPLLTRWPPQDSPAAELNVAVQRLSDRLARDLTTATATDARAHLWVAAALLPWLPAMEVAEWRTRVERWLRSSVTVSAAATVWRSSALGTPSAVAAVLDDLCDTAEESSAEGTLGTVWFAVHELLSPSAAPQVRRVSVTADPAVAESARAVLKQWGALVVTREGRSYSEDEISSEEDFPSGFPTDDFLLMEMMSLIFKFLSSRDLCTLRLVSKNWRRLADDEQVTVFGGADWKLWHRLYCVRHALSQPPERCHSWKRLFKYTLPWTWNPTETAKAAEIELSEDCLTATDCSYKFSGPAMWSTCLGTTTVNRGRLYFEIQLDKCNESNNTIKVVFGCTGKATQLRSNVPFGYTTRDRSSWCYRGDGHIMHRGLPEGVKGESFGSGDRVGFQLDFRKKMIRFYKNGVPQGRHGTGISGDLVPAVSLIDGNQVTIVQPLQLPFGKSFVNAQGRRAEKKPPG